MPSTSTKGRSCTHALGAPWAGIPMARTPGNPKAQLRSSTSKEVMNRATGGKPSEEIQPESIEGPKRYSVPDPPHGVKVIAQIMQRVKGARGHLAGHVQVAKIRPRMMPAGVAAALRIERAVVLGVPGVPDVDATFT